jgi:hypothetical protein
MAIFFNFASMNGEYSQWIIPYFSGAENTEWFGSWSYSTEEESDFLSATNKEKVFWNFKKFSKDQLPELFSYEYNDIGYLYAVKISRFVFPFLPGVLSVMILQILLHAVLCIFILFSINRLGWPYIFKYVFILFYAINPLILYYVTSPFYFSWQVLPSVLWLVFLVYPKYRSCYRFLAAIIIIGVFSFLLRPTTAVPNFILFMLVVMSKHRKLLFPAIIGLICCLLAAFSYVSSKLPWHPMYVGLGAYGGFEVSSISDNESYELFYEKTGEIIQTNIPGFSWNDKDFRAGFYRVIKNEYLNLAAQKPHLILRNALFNMIQSLGLGHRPGNNPINLLSGMLGILVITIVLLSKQYYLLIALISTSMGYALYFPPIPAYNFGMYILNIYSVLNCSAILYARFISRKYCVD